MAVDLSRRGTTTVSTVGTSNARPAFGTNAICRRQIERRVPLHAGRSQDVSIVGRRQIPRPVPPQRKGDRPAGRLFASQTRTRNARPYILPVTLRRDEQCSSGIRNECNLPQANRTSRSLPRRKVAGRFHREPQANPTSRAAVTQGDRPGGRLFASQTRTRNARPYILPVMLCRDEHRSSGIRNECNLPEANPT